MPVTFWTMTIATFTIAGFPPFAAFFSKDEILWKAYSSPNGSWIFWLIGLITAFITSFYMFRLWFMTFFGDYRGASADEGPGHGHDHADDHGRGHGPHESSWVMLSPLVILAVLSVVGGWVGIGGRFEHFLAPVFQSGVGAELATETAGEAVGTGAETVLMLISVGAACLGLFLAYLLYYKRRDLPSKIAQGLGGLYTTIAHKYYIDEIYAALFVKPLVDGSTAILWHGVDQGMIDATVNESAHVARQASDAARHMQSGNLRSYAGWIAAGGAAVIAYMVWMGVR
jgi:NADH-quinone oxidoreductase subunit L